MDSKESKGLTKNFMNLEDFKEIVQNQSGFKIILRLQKYASEFKRITYPKFKCSQ